MLRVGRWRRWLLFTLAGFVLLATAIVFLEPTGVALGLLRGESIHRYRPTSHWREVLRADAEAGEIRAETVELLRGYSALGVLLQCATDPDPNVRWPAVRLLSRRGFYREKLPVLRQTLRDTDAEVRLQSLIVLGEFGPEAMSVAKDVVPLLRDPESQIQHYAGLALWQMHVPTALQAEGWKEFRSEKWGFTAVFPELPTERQKVIDWPIGEVTVHSFWSTHRFVTQCVVAVSEYPQDYLDSTTAEKRLEHIEEIAPFTPIPEAKLKIARPVELGACKGKEVVLEVPGKGELRTRYFDVRGRLYQVNVTSTHEFLNRQAADYFLDSFRLAGVE